MSKKIISGKIDKVIYRNSSSGRTILVVNREDGKTCRIIGNILRDVETGLNITAEGEWAKDEKYGWQFMAETIEVLSFETFDSGLYGEIYSFEVNRTSFDMVFVESDIDGMDSFYIGKTPVTQDQWMSVMGDNNSEFFDDDTLPVESVEWIECLKFAVKLSLITGKTFWLPTEQEWMYAAHGGKKTKGYMYSGSDNLGDVAWYEDNAEGSTHPVAMKQPNELGLYDINGNVWEFCYDLDSYNNSICCGGSFDSSDYEKLDNYRDDQEAVGFVSCDIGLRVILLSDEHIMVDNEKLNNHIDGIGNGETNVISKKTFFRDCDFSVDVLFDAYDRMFYNLHEFGDEFDYDLVLLLLKLTEGNENLRERLSMTLSDWLEVSEF